MMPDLNSKKEILKDLISDLVTDLIYYDRKDDEDLPRGAIEKMLSKGVITKAWMAEQFERSIHKELKGVI